MLVLVYQEHVSQMPGAVGWTRTATVADTIHRIIPDGGMDVIWIDGRLLVAGPDTQAKLAEGTAGTRYIGMRFAPGIGPGVLGIPAHELRDARVPLSDLWPEREVAELAERIAHSPTGDLVLERAVLRRLRLSGAAIDPVMQAVARGIRAGAPVAATADSVGLSERQLHRRSLAAFGYGPKVLARVLRMNRALAMARQGVPFAVVAAQTGYADQAHLAREVRDLTGAPLRELTNPA